MLLILVLLKCIPAFSQFNSSSMANSMLGICIVLFVIVNITAAQSACRTPDGWDGMCIVLQQCPSLLRMLRNDPTPEQRNFLTRSQCGRDGRNILVCCPNTFTADDLPSGENCGTVVHDKIVGGERAGLTEFPWLTLLHYRKPNGREAFACGGSLIHEYYVLTAAHCIRHPSLTRSRLTLDKVRLGENDLRENPDCLEKECVLPFQDIPIAEQLIHEKYDQATNVNDIALLRLEHPATFTNSVRPVCLPFENLQNKNYDRVPMSIAGFGRIEDGGRKSETKQKLTLNGVNWSQCADIYRRKASTTLGSNVICAGGEEDKDSCQGDSGGPMTADATNDGDTFSYLVGVVSFGLICGERDVPGVYTRVDKYLDWILDHMKK